MQVKFKDPDNLPGSFQTDYLGGVIVAKVPGPNEINWVLKLDDFVECFDGSGQTYVGSTFLLKPGGMDAEAEMKKELLEISAGTQIVTSAMFLHADRIPDRIPHPENYRDYPYINAARLTVQGS